MYPKDRADESNYARYIGVERPPLAKLEELLKSAEKLFDLSFSTACFPRCLMFARRFAGSNPLALKFESKDSFLFHDS